MSKENYETEWWGIVYDQWNEHGGRQNVHEREFQFYRDQLQNIRRIPTALAFGRI